MFEFEAYEVLKTKEFTVVNDCFQNEYNEKIGHYGQTLTSFSDNDNYGFTQEQPIKVGNGPNGAPANERAYLDLLRDGQGKPISYYREGSCCAHESKNGFNGMAMLDIYVINYYNENGIKETAKVYISMYDYEEPLIIKGFQTVKLIKSSR